MRLTPQIICDILKEGMSLEDDQIWIFNQRRTIPQDKRLYVVVGLLSSRVYGNNNTLEYSDANVEDRLEQFVRELISIDLMSYSMDAIERYGEVLGSLQSTYAQQTQEYYALQIAKIPLAINNVSSIDGATLLNRISISLHVMRKYSMILNTEFYDRITPGYIALTDPP